MRFSLLKLLKTNVDTMSTFRLSTMLVKTHELNHSLHDVDEKKGSYRIGGAEFGIRGDAEPLAPSLASCRPGREAMPATCSFLMPRSG